MRAFAPLTLTLILALPATALANTATHCDFDGDNFDDLAVGVPGESINWHGAGGGVHVLYGSTSGVLADNDTWLHQDKSGVLNTVEDGDNFGAVLACGDFNGDGFDDLAVGVPGEGNGATAAVGMVHIFRGGASGLGAADNVLWEAPTQGGHRFGASLAVGRFNSDGLDDLAVGIPMASNGVVQDAGAVAIYRGEAGTSTPLQLLTRITGTAGGDNVFGDALAAGNFSGDARDELAVGEPGGFGTRGRVWVFRNLDGTPLSNVITEGTAGVAGATKTGDRFGEVLAAGDFDGNGRDDLAVGMPLQDNGAVLRAGAVSVLYAADIGTTGSIGFHFKSTAQHLSSEFLTAGKGEQFGLSLGVGQIDADGIDDLVVGAPGQDNAGGALVWMRGTSWGLDIDFASVVHQDSWGIRSIRRDDEHFGSTLAMGDYNNDGNSDVAVGVPGEAINGDAGAGAFHVIYANSNGLGTWDTMFHQDTWGMAGSAETGDMVGVGAEVSAGLYRHPYADGTSFHINRDARSHSLPGKLDLGASDNTVVVAAADGVVRFAVEFQSSGGGPNNYIWLQHPNGEWTKYSHMAPLPNVLHSVGQQISRGQAIGLQSNVGTGGSHLHFEVFVPEASNPVINFVGTNNDNGTIEGVQKVPRFCDGLKVTEHRDVIATGCGL